MAILRYENGERIHYEAHGPEDGPVVIMLHGWCASLRLYVEQTRALAEAGYRVVLLDSAGHGRSGRHVSATGKEALVERHLMFVEKLGLDEKPYALVGHSAGGAIARQIYLRRKSNVACLVLLSTGYKMADTLPRRIFWPMTPPLVELMFQPLSKLVLMPAVNVGADAAGALFHKNPDDIRLWMGDVMRMRPDLARKEIEEILQYDLKDELKDIECPTLIIGGGMDLLAPARQSRVMHELIPDSELHILPVGHAGKMLNAELFNPVILDFLARRYPSESNRKS